MIVVSAHDHHLTANAVSELLVALEHQHPCTVLCHRLRQRRSRQTSAYDNQVK
jgi:hypothetical protein